MPGPHRTRADAIAVSRRVTPRYRVPFPDLKVEQRTSPCSNVIAKTAPRETSAAKHKDALAFPVGHSHKQGTQLITPAQLTNGELQWMGGKKS